MDDFFWPLLAGLAGGYVLTQIMKPPKMPEQQMLGMPEQNPAQPATPATQAEQKPDYNRALGKNKANEAKGPSAGPASTFLTGPMGVDPSQLNLGRNMLLGA